MEIDEDLLKHWKRDRETQNYSPTTLKTYSSIAGHFRQHLLRAKGRADTGDLNRATIQAYVNLRADRDGVSAAYRKSILLSLRNLCDWMVSRKFLLFNPATEIPLPIIKDALRTRCSDADVLAMLKACDRLTPPRRAAMARAVVSLCAYSGLRRAEILDLKLENVEFEESRIQVLGKGGKRRFVHPHRACLDALSAWLLQRGRCTHSFLFDIDHSRRMADNGLRSLWRDVLTAADMAERIPNLTPHTVRRNYARRLYLRGVKIELIQHEFGHADPATTLLYIGVQDEDRRDLGQFGSLEEEDVRTLTEPERIPAKPPRFRRSETGARR